MAETQPKANTRSSVVGECTATDCRHNEDRECHAGEIVVQMNGNGAVCGTYAPETPRPRP